MKQIKKIFLFLLLTSIFCIGAIAGDGLTDEKQRADVIVVFGSKVHQATGQPSERLQARLDTALSLYNQEYASHIIVSGGVGREGHDEAIVMGEYLENNGVDPDAIFVDSEGINTYHTAAYTQKKMEEESWHSALVVSDYFHIARAKFALDQFGVEDVYGVHSNMSPGVSDVYALPRELVALVSYAAREYPSDTHPAVQQDAATQSIVEVIAVPLNEVTVSGEYSDTPKRVSQWAEDIYGEFVVINGAYFLENNQPAGYLVTDGQVITSRMFDRERSGLLLVNDGKVEIRDLSTDAFEIAESPQLAVQSYPFLIQHGSEAIETDSGNKGRRTAIGIDQAGETLYIFTVTSRNISLYEFMEEIKALELPVYHVLNLDGGTSTGIYANINGEKIRHDSFIPVPNVITIQKR